MHDRDPRESMSVRILVTKSFSFDLWQDDLCRVKRPLELRLAAPVVESVGQPKLLAIFELGLATTRDSGNRHRQNLAQKYVTNTVCSKNQLSSSAISPLPSKGGGAKRQSSVILLILLKKFVEVLGQAER